MSSIVLFGALDHIKHVSAGIVSYNHLCSQSESASLPELIAKVFSEKVTSLPFQISNKYFTVDLELLLYSSREHESFHSKLSSAECCIIVASDEVITKYSQVCFNFF